MEDDGVGVLVVVITGQFRFGEGKEKYSGGIGQRGGNKRGGGNAPGNNYRHIMRTGVHSSNLTY